ncbi:MAG: ABC transporter substrate-binding protein [Halanaerobiales bacterium]|nr:ABC transporter substrate-binding protein [Halanaerobiales bacterium]
MSRKNSSILILFLVISLMLVGSIGVYAQNSKVTVAVDAPPRTMNPHGSDADSNLSVMSNFFEGLVQRDSSGKLKPALATSWERIDRLTWRFELRKGVKFHNGNDFTWEDVQYTFAERMENPEVSEFISFGSAIESVSRVDGNDWVIDIVTKDPIPYFIQNLHQIFIVDKESTLERSQGEMGTKPIGTGPYVLDQWTKGSYIRMTANEDYWEGAPEVKTAEIRPITEASTRLATISSGEVDVLQGVPVTMYEAVEGNPNLEVITRPSRRAIYLGLANKEGTPTADIRVRQAMYMAINIDELIDKVMFGHATPAAQIPDPPTTGYSEKIERLPYDPERARELLKEAGYEDGFEIKLSAPNDRYVQDEQIASTIASYLSKVGIKVEVDAKPKSVYFEEVMNNELDFHLIGWFDGSYDFGRSYSRLLHEVEPKSGYGSTNGSAYADPVADQLYELTKKVVDPDIRGSLLEDLNRLAMSKENLAVIPLHYQEDTYAVYSDSPVEFNPRSDTWIVFKEMSFK